MQDLKIAIIQADILWEKPVDNRRQFGFMIHAISSEADLIVLPETFTTGFPVNPAIYAEECGGETMQWMHQQASMKDAVICGTIPLKIHDRYHNTLVWMRPDGTFELYHKRHPFSIGGEDKLVTAGHERLIVKLKGWKICPMICYDLRFPVWARNHYDDNDYEYDLLLYTANFPNSRMLVWNTLPIARAIENQSYVVAVNRIGTDPNGLEYDGASMVIDPKGKIKFYAPSKQESIQEVTLEAASLTEFRKKFPLGPDWDSFSIDK